MTSTPRGRVWTRRRRRPSAGEVLDARAYIGFLRASIALTAGQVAEARRYIDSVNCGESYGNPPPQFAAAVLGLSARISVFEPEAGPEAGLRGVTDALRLAVEAECAEVVTAHLAEAAGSILPKVGRHAAVRLLAASDTWRAYGPRSAVEEAEVKALLEALRERLGERAYAEERAAGQGLTPRDAIALLTEVADETGRGRSGTKPVSGS